MFLYQGLKWILYHEYKCIINNVSTCKFEIPLTVGHGSTIITNYTTRSSFIPYKTSLGYFTFIPTTRPIYHNTIKTCKEVHKSRFNLYQIYIETSSGNFRLFTLNSKYMNKVKQQLKLADILNLSFLAEPENGKLFFKSLNIYVIFGMYFIPEIKYYSHLEIFCCTTGLSLFGIILMLYFKE